VQPRAHAGGHHQHPGVARGAQLGTLPLDGFIGPAHVSTIIGSQPYEFFAEEYRKPVVIAGFEPLDVMQAILMLVRQINEGRAEVENEFSRAVTRDGNLKAQALVSEVMECAAALNGAAWAKCPTAPCASARPLRPLTPSAASICRPASVADNKACECGAILRGVKHPRDCKVFGTVCTPDNPIGSCMVSSEGACAAGGRAMAQLIAGIFQPAFDNELLRRGNDQAVAEMPPGAHRHDD
jgi:hydrogenase expression/formation protein HypD